jgi:hypothetical protein
MGEEGYVRAYSHHSYRYLGSIMLLGVVIVIIARAREHLWPFAPRATGPAHECEGEPRIVFASTIAACNAPKTTKEAAPVSRALPFWDAVEQWLSRVRRARHSRSCQIPPNLTRKVGRPQGVLPVPLNRTKPYQHSKN